MPELLLFPSVPVTRAPQPSVTTEALSDADARAAALDIRRSWIVEAPAGSGKTGLLIQRFLKLLAYSDIQRPTEVLVLTFTRKADGELRSRILEQLTAAAEARPLPPDAGAFERITREFADAVLLRDKSFGWHLLDSPAQLNIRTIDSFCAELAKSMPLLSGGGRLRPAEDASPLYQLASERTLAQLGGPDPLLHDALRLLLQHRDAQVGDCLRLIAGMLAQREQWSELIPLDSPALTDEYLDTVVRSRLDDTLERIVSAGLAYAADILGTEDLAGLASLAARLSWLAGYKDEPDPYRLCGSLQGTIPTGGDFLPQWIAAINLVLTGGGDWRKRFRAGDLKCEIDEVDRQALELFTRHLEHRGPSLHEALLAVRALPPARYPEDDWPLIKAVCRILRHALSELRGVFATRGQCDFSEIALTARALLRPDSARNNGQTDPLTSGVASLAHLLVDEMQDTSAGQYQLLESVTEFWDGASQTVFLVGDPKQSIYAFRQARVERFLRTMETGRLGDLSLAPLRLTANFRSQAALVGAFNETFTNIFAAPAESTADQEHEPAGTQAIAVPFVQATAVRPAHPGPSLHWHPLVKSDASGSHTVLSDYESEQALRIRQRIEAFLDAWPTRSTAAGLKPRPAKVAVLARNRSHLAPILAEFKTDRGNGPLLFRAVDVEALNERPEVLDLLALTRALLHPADRIAWLAVLRSPVCGLTLRDLLALTGEGPGSDPHATVPHLLATRLAFLSPEGQDLTARVWPILNRALNSIGSTELSTLIERTWRTLGGDAPLTPEARRNADRFLDLLRKLEESGDVLSLSLLKKHLLKLYAEPTSTATSVELMTIHKAKGLEWDLVLVPSLERGSGQNEHGLLKWLEIDNPETDADLLLAPIQSKGTDTAPLSRWLNRGERRREAAEARRLFYVACTRAREELHLFASLDLDASGAPCAPTSPSLLQAAWPAAQPVLTEMLRPAPDNVIPFAPTAQEQPFSLAAAADQVGDNAESETAQVDRAPALSHAARLQRLPSGFHPTEKFLPRTGARLPYAAPEDLRRSAVFARPEGSFAARAFGNTLHRFLQVLAVRRAAGTEVRALETEIPAWTPRLIASLRNEGLPQALATTEATRALAALVRTLQDPEGVWLLEPHRGARNESNLASAGSPLRADRTFYSSASPLQTGDETFRWIVDYKTAELGGRSREAFFADQKGKYLPQMQAYAEAATRAGTPSERIRLALYFPLLPALLFWPADPALTH